MSIFKKKEKTRITEKEKKILLFLLLNDIMNDPSILTIKSRIQKVIELLEDLGVTKERLDLNKNKPSDELVEEIFYNLNVPSQDMAKHDYKVYKKIYDRL